MAQRVPIPIPSRDAVGESKFAGTQMMLNCFVEPNAEEGTAVYGCPGFGAAWATCASGGVRGYGEFNDVMLVVAGTKLYTVTSAGAVTDRGTIAGSPGTVQISSNGLQAVIVGDPTHSYVWDGTNLLAITDPDFPGASSVDFIDQYGVFSKSNSGAWFLSALADFQTYDALDIVTSEMRPDNIVRIVTDGREVLVFGTRTIEGNYDAGGASFPFERTQLSIEVGLIGRDALGRVVERVIWIAHDKTVRIMSGATPEVVSDPQIQRFIESWGDLSTVRGFPFMVRGHAMFAFRHDNGCAVIDMATKRWHRRASNGSATWRICGALDMWGYTHYFDAATGAIFRQDVTKYQEAGDPLPREIWTATIGPGGAPFTVDGAILEADAGVSAAGGDKYYLAFSRDEGRTFGTAQNRAMAASNTQHRQLVWNDGYGQFQPHGGVMKFGMTDNAEFIVRKAWADITADRP